VCAASLWQHRLDTFCEQSLRRKGIVHRPAGNQTGCLPPSLARLRSSSSSQPLSLTPPPCKLTSFPATWLFFSRPLLLPPLRAYTARPLPRSPPHPPPLPTHPTIPPSPRTSIPLPGLGARMVGGSVCTQADTYSPSVCYGRGQTV